MYNIIVRFTLIAYLFQFLFNLIINRDGCLRQYRTSSYVVFFRFKFGKYSEPEKGACWYLNLLKKSTERLDAMGFKGILEERTDSEL